MCVVYHPPPIAYLNLASKACLVSIVWDCDIAIYWCNRSCYPSMSVVLHSEFCLITEPVCVCVCGSGEF